MSNTFSASIEIFSLVWFFILLSGYSFIHWFLLAEPVAPQESSPAWPAACRLPALRPESATALRREAHARQAHPACCLLLQCPCCQGNAGLAKWVWKAPSSSVFGQRLRKGLVFLLFERLLELPQWNRLALGSSHGRLLVTDSPSTHHLPVCSDVQARHGPGLLGCVSQSLCISSGTRLLAGTCS